MLVRVTLRAPLEGRIAVSFASRPGAGRARRSAVIHGRRSASFLFTGDARNLSRVAWGRRMARLAFTFDLSGGSGLGAVAPVVTASWR
jgi:hypothetical protein